jgi:hypothetical protein
MKRMSTIFAILSLVLASSLAISPGVLLANHGEPHRPRPKPSATPIPTPTPAPVQLAAPTLISPPDGALVSKQVTFMWSPVSGAACYTWEGGLTTDFEGQSNLYSSCLTDTSYTITLLPGWEEYWPHLYWHVRARDRVESDITGRFGPWSETWLVYLTSQ